MFGKTRALWLVLLLWLGGAGAAGAFTFSYGNLLDVKDVQNEGGALVLPLTRGKYRNVKVLSKDVYDFLLQCRTDCHYEAAQAEFYSDDYRRALTQERLMIADVTLNHELVLTFLVFKNKDGFSVKMPDVVVFKDKQLVRRLRAYLEGLAKQVL